MMLQPKCVLLQHGFDRIKVFIDIKTNGKCSLRVDTIKLLVYDNTSDVALQSKSLKMERLIESYKTLFYLATQIFFFIEVYETYRDNEEYLNRIKFKGHYANLPLAKAISGNLQNYAIIVSCSFMDEYNEGFNAFKHPDYADKINKIKKITKPVIKRLNQWNNFKEYRNYILAHNFRVKGKSLFAKDVESIKFNVPHTNSEFILLAELIRVITTCIALEFPDLFHMLSSNDLPITKMKFDYNVVDINNELLIIWQQIEEIKNNIA